MNLQELENRSIYLNYLLNKLEYKENRIMIKQKRFNEELKTQLQQMKNGNRKKFTEGLIDTYNDLAYYASERNGWDDYQLK